MELQELRKATPSPESCLTCPSTRCFYTTSLPAFHVHLNVRNLHVLAPAPAASSLRPHTAAPAQALLPSVALPLAAGPSWDKLQVLFPRKGSAGRSRRAARSSSTSFQPSPRAAPAARSRPALLRGRPPSDLFPAHAASPFSAHFPPRCSHSNSRPPPLSPQPSAAAAAAGNRPRRFRTAPGQRRTVPTEQQHRAGKASAHAQRCPAPPRPSTPQDVTRLSPAQALPFPQHRACSALFPFLP